MSAEIETRPVDDSIEKVNDEIAVGSDLQFQRRWWRFERVVWIVFTVLIALDVAGAFGRGWLAKSEKETDNGARIRYDRIARYSTPSTLTVEFEPAAVRGGKVQLWTTDTLLKKLGQQRVMPEPDSVELSAGGVLDTFHSDLISNSVEFSLQPTRPGLFDVGLRVSGAANPVQLRVAVMP